MFCAGRSACAHVQRGCERRAARDANQQALFLRQILRALHGIGIRYSQHAIDGAGIDGIAQEFGDEIWRPALDRMRLEGWMSGRC